MATREEFVDAANIIWKNHGIYLWGGNGEPTPLLSFAKIATMETSRHDAYRVMKHIADLYDSGVDMSRGRSVKVPGYAVAHFLILNRRKKDVLCSIKL